MRIIIDNIHISDEVRTHVFKEIQALRSTEDIIDIYQHITDLVVEMIQGTGVDNFNNFYRKLTTNYQVLDEANNINTESLESFLFIHHCLEVAKKLWQENDLFNSNLNMVCLNLFKIINNIIGQQLNDISLIKILVKIFPPEKLLNIICEFLKGLALHHLNGYNYDTEEFEEELFVLEMDSNLFNKLVHAFKSTQDIYEDPVFSLAAQMYLFIIILGKNYKIEEAKKIFDYEYKELYKVKNNKLEKSKSLRQIQSIKEVPGGVASCPNFFAEYFDKMKKLKYKKKKRSAVSKLNNYIITAKFFHKVIKNCEFMIEKDDKLNLKTIYFIINPMVYYIDKNNIESVKLYITDGGNYERNYNMEYYVEDGNLIFESNSEINSGMVLDNLENNVQYYVLVRLKLNNSINPRIFSFENKSNNKEINYYTLTKEGTNRLAKIKFIEKEYKRKEYKFFTVNLTDEDLPEEVYDIVIDAGHGGKDPGVSKDGCTEADITLNYAYALKEKLENIGYKVKLTRDNDNTNYYTYTNMYNKDGRISIACQTRSKLMISFHVNNGEKALSGFEIYSPPNSNLDLAKMMAKYIERNTSLNYSNNSSFKESDGVYVRNYTQNEIIETTKTAEKKGFEPYNITTNTPYLYTIREVGGVATNAYADGRNKDYSKNEYYNSHLMELIQQDNNHYPYKYVQYSLP